MKKLLAPIVLAVLGLVLFLNLAFWQLDRLEWKQGLLADLDAQMAAPAIDFADYQPDDAGMTGQAVVLKGMFLDGYTDKLTGDNELGAGYIRIAPMQVGARVVMIELGYLRESEKGENFELPKGEMELQVRQYAPDANGSYDAARNLWVGYDVVGMAEFLGAEPLMFVADVSPVEGLRSRPLEIQLPNNHAQYAITWFLFALVWLAMAGYWGYARMRQDKA